MMRLGAIQKLVVGYLSRCGEDGGHIGPTTTAEEFRGLYLDQVERAIEGLLRRRVIRSEGIRYILDPAFLSPPTKPPKSN